jgi:hypothetical protein
MKLTLGLLTLLLLVTTAALGQQYQPLPFPQAANPSLDSSYYEETSPSDQSELPSAMASNQASDISFSIEDSHREGYRFDTGSPFPASADPALSRGSDRDRKFSDVDVDSDDWHDNNPGSPFPTAANER